MKERARELASAGASNFEIYADLNLTPQALVALMTRDAQFVLSIIEGRAEFVRPILERLLELATDPEAKTSKLMLPSGMALMERYDKMDQALMAAHSLAILEGVMPEGGRNTVSKAQVTDLLRKTA